MKSYSESIKGRQYPSKREENDEMVIGLTDALNSCDVPRCMCLSFKSKVLCP